MPYKRRKDLSLSAKMGQPYCSRCGQSNSLHRHHIMPLADGGQDTDENSDVLCSPCHKEWHRYEHMIEYEDFLDTVPALFMLGVQSFGLNLTPPATLDEIKDAFLGVRFFLIRKKLGITVYADQSVDAVATAMSGDRR